MENKQKKYYELDDLERKEYRQKIWKKAWKVIKKVLFGLFCISLILLIVFSLLNGVFDNQSNETSTIILKLAA